MRGCDVGVYACAIAVSGHAFAYRIAYISNALPIVNVLCALVAMGHSKLIGGFYDTHKLLFRSQLLKGGWGTYRNLTANTNSIILKIDFC